jgi:hypothetical protein
LIRPGIPTVRAMQIVVELGIKPIFRITAIVVPTKIMATELMAIAGMAMAGQKIRTKTKIKTKIKVMELVMEIVMGTGMVMPTERMATVGMAGQRIKTKIIVMEMEVGMVVATATTAMAAAMTGKRISTKTKRPNQKKANNFRREKTDWRLPVFLLNL